MKKRRRALKASKEFSDIKRLTRYFSNMRMTQDPGSNPELNVQRSAQSAHLSIPDPSLILLIGPSGAGKSTFAAAHFRPTEIVSSDRCRALICDDESNQNVNREAFELLHHVTALRLRLNKLTVIDATNLQAWGRAPLLKIAQHHRTPAAAVIFKVSLETALVNNRRRDFRVVDEAVIRQHFLELDGALPQLSNEGYQSIYILNEAELETVQVVRLNRVENLISDTAV